MQWGRPAGMKAVGALLGVLSDNANCYYIRTGRYWWKRRIFAGTGEGWWCWSAGARLSPS